MTVDDILGPPPKQSVDDILGPPPSVTFNGKVYPQQPTALPKAPVPTMWDTAVPRPASVPEIGVEEPYQQTREEARQRAIRDFTTGAAQTAGVTPENVQKVSDYVRKHVPLSIVRQGQLIAGTAAAKTAAGFLDYMTSPEGLVTTGLAALPPTRIPTAIAFFRQAAAQGGKSASDAMDAWQKGDLQGTADAVANTIGSLGTAFAIGKGISPKTPVQAPSSPLQASEPTVRTTETPEASKPLLEALQAKQRPSTGFSLSPEQQAILERSVTGRNLEQPAGAVPPSVPSQGPAIPFSIPESELEKANREAAKRAKPTVPETAPEPERNESVVQEIQRRGLDTKRKIQSVFPHLSNQEAQSLWRAAYPEKVEANKPKDKRQVITPQQPPPPEMQAFGLNLGVVPEAEPETFAEPEEVRPKASTADILPQSKLEQAKPAVQPLSATPSKPATAVPTPKEPEKLVPLYRAEGGQYKFSDVFKPEALKQFASDKEGESWTDDPKYADYFKETYGKGATVKKILVPESELKQYETPQGEYKIPTSVRAKYESKEPEVPPIPQGQKLVTIQKADGTTIPAVANEPLKFWTHPTKGQVPAVGRLVNGKWSHGMLGDGEKIVEEQTKSPQVVSLDEYLGSKGVRSAPSFPEYHRTPGKLSEQSKKKASQRVQQAMDEYAQKREQAVKEYESKVASGELQPPTRQEQMEQIAKGEGQAAEAAKRLLAKRQPSMAGPGSPSITQGPDVTAPNEAGGQIYGVSQKARTARAESGQVPEIGPGKGTTGEETVLRGRELLRQGFDAPAALEHFEKTKQITPDAAMAIRAFGENLAKQMVHAEKTFGTTSPQFIDAYQAMADWDKRTKPIATGAHELFTSFQGTTDIDTGTYSGLARQHKADTGREFTPDQKKQAEGIAKTVETTTEQAKNAQEALFNELDKQGDTQTPQGQSKRPISNPESKEQVRESLKDHKTGKPFTPEQVKRIWNYARTRYIDKGENDFGDLLSNVAADLGLDRSEVARALAMPKGAKRLTNDMYKKMSDRRRAVQQAKWWLKQQQSPRWLQMIRSIPRAFFVAKVFGHGTVGMVTHAGMNLFNPASWSKWFPAYVKQWELWLSSAKHEAWAQEIVRRPNFITARRAGLANDPFRYEDDYQNQFLGKWVSKFGGNRGFDALKDFRQNRFDQMWNKLPESLQTPEMAKAIADNVNHSTGIIKTTLPAPFQEIANWTLFAPKLEGSRWAWLIGDTAKTAYTFKEWKNATPEQKYAAMADMRQKAAIVGTYFATLMMNQGFLSAAASPQKINWTNPRKSDFLQFKVAGHTVGVISPILGMIKLFSNLYHDATGKRGKVESLSTRASEEASTAGSYARGKASPVASFTSDLLGQADYEGRPLPFSSDKTPAFLRREGLGPYTYSEYLSQTLSPIPLETLGPAVVKTVKDVWTDQGIPADQQKALLNGILTFGIEGGTGIRFSQDYNAK